MISTIVWTFIALVFLAFIARSKYVKQNKVKKQWEGRDPDVQPPSTEELRQNESKYRKPDGGMDGSM